MQNSESATGQAPAVDTQLARKDLVVKLLAKLYLPDSGRIVIDGVDLARIDAVQWRLRLAGTFQDFFRFEFQAGQTVGLGDLPRMDAEPALFAALDRAGARDAVEKLPAGLRTQLGPTWPDGVDVSFGQWQKLALARGFMRDEPLLTVLDEPTAALDAKSELEVFERFAELTIDKMALLISHRFSTVRMADRIVVLHGGQLVEQGNHQQLMALGGRYAEMFEMQAASYR